MLQRTMLLALVALVTIIAAQDANHGQRLISFSENFSVWLEPDEVEQLHRNTDGLHYMDITDHQVPVVHHELKRFARKFPTSPSHQTTIKPMLNKLDPSLLVSTISSMAEYFNRWYTTESGRDSAVWVRDAFEQVRVKSGNRSDAKVEFFTHSWLQPSVIATITGSEKPDEIVVVGAHLDSTAGGATRRAPGADDDATGVANALDAWRVILESGFRPKRTLQFMSYAAEEVGLRGSQGIAQAYARDNQNVYAVYQCEMSGYVGRQKTITIIEDFVDAELTKFVQALVREYSEIDYQLDRCGYGCSDHASWTRSGYSAAIAAEAGPRGDVNPYMHTSQDTLDKLDPLYSNEFSKLALSFAIELSEY